MRNRIDPQFSYVAKELLQIMKRLEYLEADRDAVLMKHWDDMEEYLTLLSYHSQLLEKHKNLIRRETSGVK